MGSFSRDAGDESTRQASGRSSSCGIRNWRRPIWTWGVLLSGALSLSGLAARWAFGADSSSPSEPALSAALPLGLPRLPRLLEGSPSPGMIELGKQLFFDPRLSADSTISCASCHDPDKGWSNGEAIAVGIGGQAGTRNGPTGVNSVYALHYFWDGRSASLEDVVPQPIQHPAEMGLSLEDAENRINAIAGYRAQFHELFGSDASRETIAASIAAFLRTLVAGNSPYDRFRAGDLEALSPAARRGHDVFFFRSNCQMCHRGPLLTDGGFHNLGVGMDADAPDIGRAAVTGDHQFDTGAFRTPSLRDVSRTAPYMHDGRFQTLEEVLDFYVEAGFLNTHRMQMLNILVLDDQELADLATFLREGLTSDDYPTVERPELPE